MPAAVSFSFCLTPLQNSKNDLGFPAVGKATAPYLRKAGIPTSSLRPPRNHLF